MTAPGRQHHAFFAVECYRVQRAVHTGLASGEPDLFPIRRPRHALNGEPLTRESLLRPILVDNRQRTAVVPLHRMIDEGDHVSLGREARMPDPSAGFVERLSNRIFEAVTSAYIAHHDQAVAVRCPVGPLHLLQHFSRSASHQRSPRQRAHVDPRADGLAVEQHGHLGG